MSGYWNVYGTLADCSMFFLTIEKCCSPQRPVFFFNPLSWQPSSLQNPTPEPPWSSPLRWPVPSRRGWRPGSARATWSGSRSPCRDRSDGRRSPRFRRWSTSVAVWGSPLALPPRACRTAGGGSTGHCAAKRCCGGWWKAWSWMNWAVWSWRDGRRKQMIPADGFRFCCKL